MRNMGTPPENTIHAFVGEYRERAVQAVTVLDAMTRAGSASFQLGFKDLSHLERMAYVLGNAAAFLNFPRLSAVARVLRDALPVGVDIAKPTVMNPAQTRMLADGFALAARMVDSLRQTGAEPRMDTELERFAQTARALGLEWELAANGADSQAPVPEQDRQRVESLLAEDAPPATPAATPPRTAAAADMLSIFVQDTEEILDHAEQDLLQLEQAPARLHDLLRHFHTLKGNSGLMGYDAMQKFSHRVESALQSIRDHNQPPSKKEIRVLLEAVDALRHAIAQVAQGGTPHGLEPEIWHERMAAFDPQTYAMDAAKAAAPPAEVHPGGATTATSPATATGRDATPRADAAPHAPTATGGVRVSVERLDQINDLAGELVIAAAMAQHMSAPHPGIDAERFNRAFHQLNLISSSLQDTAMAMRMMPVESLFRRLPRLARELADKTGKPLDLQLAGENTEVDRRVTELIADPLVHIIRNAVDHGLEAPDERRRRGKPEVGTIRVEAMHRSGEVWISVSDDGRGLQRDKIIERARARGWIADDANPGDEELFAMIMEPGFSTAEKVTEVSGRGVGLDVVKRNIERLRGRVDVHSVPGWSTTFTLRMPLTLAVIQGMIVRVGREQFVIPLSHIRESFRPAPHEVRQALGQGEMIVLRGETLPMARLSDLFHLAEAERNPSNAVVTILEDGERQMALMLDELLGQQRVVVKSVSEALGRPPGISGASIMADGHVRLIIDVSGLIRLAQETRT